MTTEFTSTFPRVYQSYPIPGGLQRIPSEGKEVGVLVVSVVWKRRDSTGTQTIAQDQEEINTAW